MTAKLLQAKSAHFGITWYAYGQVQTCAQLGAEGLDLAKLTCCLVVPVKVCTWYHLRPARSCLVLVRAGGAVIERYQPRGLRRPDSYHICVGPGELTAEMSGYERPWEASLTALDIHTSVSFILRASGHI